MNRELPEEAEYLEDLLIDGNLPRPLPDELRLIMYPYDNIDFCHSLVRQYLIKGYLSKKQWEWVNILAHAKPLDPFKPYIMQLI